VPRLAAADLFDRIADPATAPYQVTATGFVTDGSHPMHPGDFHRYDGTLSVRIDAQRGEASIAFESGEGESKSTDRYFVRRGRIFQVDDKGVEKLAEPLGDLAPATVAALYPTLVAAAIRERRENFVPPHGSERARFAWNDELWSLQVDAGSGQIKQLERRIFHDVYGDGKETVRFEAEGAPLADARRRTIVTLRGREVAAFEFSHAAPADTLAIPRGDHDRDRSRLIAPSDIEPREIAPHLFAIDLASMNTRVVVAEFADHLVVLEGAYNDRSCERIAQALKSRFAKPVRYFAFSHLHGQYVGGTRTWVHEGATVVVPPTTAPLIEQVVKAPVTLRPDALSRDPKPLHIETVADKRVLHDATNTLEIYNVPSGHTDEYFIFYFPQARILLTGDLLFYRPGKPLTGRSKQLCETIEKLGVQVDTYYPTWPLDGYGTKNVVTGDEMRAACQAAKSP